MDTLNPLEEKILAFLHEICKNSLSRRFVVDAGNSLLSVETDQQAGIVELTEDYACAFRSETVYAGAIEKIASKAAAGCGKVYREMMACGSQPLGTLLSLSTGIIPDAPELKKALADIALYGNTLGMPVAYGNLRFSGSQKRDFTANMLTIGLIDRFEEYKNTCSGVDNPVYVIGAPDTGKKIASSAFITRSLYELMCDLHDDKAIVAVQTIAAGEDIMCACATMVAAGINGIEINISDYVAEDEKNKLIIVVREDYGKKLQKACRKWNIKCDQIGVVIEERKLTVVKEKEILANLMIPEFEEDLPENDVEFSAPVVSAVETDKPTEYKEVVKALISSPNLSSQQWIFEQFDSTVGTNNLSTNYISDAAVVQLKGIRHALAVAFCQNSFDLSKYPEAANLVVAEALHKVICSGGEPRALTGCLNFGKKIDENVLKTVNKHISDFCQKMEIASSGINMKRVETDGLNISVGAIAFILEKQLQMTMSFKGKGDMIYMLGSSADNNNASEYMRNYHNVKDSAPPTVDLDDEVKLMHVARQLISRKFVNSAHNVGKGGLFMALLEAAMVRSFGFDITVDGEIRKDAFLFGEAPTRIIVSVATTRETNFIDFMMQENLPFITLGHVTREEIRVDDTSFGFISDYKKLYG